MKVTFKITKEQREAAIACLNSKNLGVDDDEGKLVYVPHWMLDGCVYTPDPRDFLMNEHQTWTMLDNVAIFEGHKTALLRGRSNWVLQSLGENPVVKLVESSRPEVPWDKSLEEYIYENDEGDGAFIVREAGLHQKKHGRVPYSIIGMARRCLENNRIIPILGTAKCNAQYSREEIATARSLAAIAAMVM